MSEQNQPVVCEEHPCAAPALNDLLTAYCFGRTTSEESQHIKAHLLGCETCRAEQRRLTAAVMMLDTDSSLKALARPGEVAAAFGLSGQLIERFGGHRFHCLMLAAIYGLLGALCVILETAYEFDQFAKKAVPFALLAGLWLFGTARLAFWCDWRLTARERSHGLKLSFLIFTFGAAVCAMVAAGMVLPAHSITKLTDTAMPAQIAYTGGLIYHLLAVFIFSLPTYHFILAMQREMLNGRHTHVFGLVTQDRSVPPPRGLLFPRMGYLIFLVAAFVLWRGSAYFSLIAKLQPDKFHLLFSVVVQLRLLLYFILIVKSVHWYSSMLNEIKRECLLAERLEKAG